MLSENCIWTAPVCTDYISAPGEELPGTLQKGIRWKGPPKCLPKSTLGVHFGSKAEHLGPKAPERVAKRARKEGQMTTKSRKFIQKIAPGRPRGSRHPPGCKIIEKTPEIRGKNLPKTIQKDAKSGLKKGHNSALIYLDLVLRTLGGVPRNNKKNTERSEDTCRNSGSSSRSRAELALQV